MDAPCVDECTLLSMPHAGLQCARSIPMLGHATGSLFTVLSTSTRVWYGLRQFLPGFLIFIVALHTAAEMRIVHMNTNVVRRIMDVVIGLRKRA